MVLSLMLAMLLTVVPMPETLEDYRPQWVALAIVFWCLALPLRVGVFWAFGAGLALDILTGSLLGEHALSLSVLAYLTGMLRSGILLFPLWQQAFFIWLLLLVERLLSLWVIGATGQPMPPLSYWSSTFGSLLVWPWLFLVLRIIGRRIGSH
ncbi:Rod shape-determining protein MreD [Imhoffiella purpurea]|uniref:Rod shape-determining protein MreD n=1 Tax=Imhoffiella purpurea TaxID=1249627 RepID=W9VMA8_9GAMM|nr:Rod shape-determining protein MreD [Imhoffiella purpurea]